MRAPSPFIARSIPAHVSLDPPPLAQALWQAAQPPTLLPCLPSPTPLHSHTSTSTKAKAAARESLRLSLSIPLIIPPLHCCRRTLARIPARLQPSLGAARAAWVLILDCGLGSTSSSVLSFHVLAAEWGLLSISKDGAAHVKRSSQSVRLPQSNNGSRGIPFRSRVCGGK